jgi:hypothetical protein
LEFDPLIERAGIAMRIDVSRSEIMKAAVAVFVLSASLGVYSIPLRAQNEAPKTLAACGDLNVDLSVDLDKRAQDTVVPQPDKAVVYFIQETGLDINLFYPTTRVGVDGKWVGGNKKNSYFSFVVAPGEHHVCVAIQSSIVKENGELTHFRAEAGKVYYFRTRISWGKDAPQYLSVEPVDSDEAKYLIGSFSLARLHPRK